MIDQTGSWLEGLALNRVSGEQRAGLHIASVPWPRRSRCELSLGKHATACRWLGAWPGSDGQPRRAFLVADGGQDAAPDKTQLNFGQTPWPADVPSAESVQFARCDEPGFMWERHLMRVQWEGRSIGLALGLRHAGEVHWWEACRLVTLEEGPGYRVMEMGGAIPCDPMSGKQFHDQPGLDNPWLHRHNWLNGVLHVRLYANGACEVIARHINSRYVDDGADLEDVVPVIAWAMDPEQVDATDHKLGPWDGSVGELNVGDAAMDLSEAARLATPESPGRLDREDDWLVWQPYGGAELYGGDSSRQRTDDPYIYRAKDRCFPMGMARTVRFSFSLNPERSPAVARYMPPASAYAQCEEFSPQSLDPVGGPYNEHFDYARQWVRNNIERGGFEDGSIPRHLKPNADGSIEARPEPGWEGEIPYAHLMGAWRSGNGGDYLDAIRSAYHFTDLIVDHAAKMVRMHGFPPVAYALPMVRMQGPIAAYLETADPYLLETAEAVTEQAYRTHRNSWPRLAVGRDACFARSAVLLYRYFDSEHFRRIARDIAMAVVEVQKPDGTFGDQGGGAGIHQWGAYITKPWMGLLALNCVIDYMELFSDEDAMADCVLRFADWLMASRISRGGVMTWGYQHDFNGEPRHFDPLSGRWIDLPSAKEGWHHDTLARLLGYCTMRTGDAKYIEAWAESRAGDTGNKSGDHACSASLQFIPWLQDRFNAGLLAAPAFQLRPDAASSCDSTNPTAVS